MTHAKRKRQEAEESERVQDTSPYVAVALNGVDRVAFEVHFPDADATCAQLEADEQCEEADEVRYVTPRRSSHTKHIASFFLYSLSLSLSLSLHLKSLKEKEERKKKELLMFARRDENDRPKSLLFDPDQTKRVRKRKEAEKRGISSSTRNENYPVFLHFEVS